MSTMRISELAERSGVPVTTLRFYDTVGLLPAGRTGAGYRVYDAQALERLAFIGAAKRLGLALAEIAELAAVWESGTCPDVKADLRPRVAARLREAEGAAAGLAAWTGFLQSALAQLDALPDRPGRCDPGCGYPPAGTPDPAAGRPRPGPPARHLAPGGEAGQQAEVLVACSLSAGQASDRIGEWRAVTAGAAVEQIPGGARLTLPADQAGRVASLAAAEQRCCPFFDFLLHLDGPVLQFEVRAPAAAAGVLTGLFAPER